MFPKLKWILLAVAVLLGIVILWPPSFWEKASSQSAKSNVAAAPSTSATAPSAPAKPVNVSSSEPARPAVFAPTPGAVANVATNNTAGSFIPVAEASRPEELKPGSYEPDPKAKLVDWEILPTDPSRPNILTRARLLDVTGGAASAATSAAEAARISAAQGIKYPFVRVEEELALDAQGKVASSRVTREMVADEIIVKFPEGTRMTAAAEIAAQLGGVAAEKPFAPMTWLIAVPVSLRAVPSAVEGSKSATPYAEYAEPNLLVRPVATPNDTRYNDLWHLNNTVELNSDIRAESAWDSDTNADGVIVAVIDTGVRYTHEDLAANMWVNPGETAGNGIDDDSNGYIDDVYGADEYSNDGNPADGGGHGTMV
ncbi:MAG: S8 family serine peptidase, partial [Planctomycetia bacterium]